MATVRPSPRTHGPDRPAWPVDRAESTLAWISPLSRAAGSITPPARSWSAAVAERAAQPLAASTRAAW